MDEDKLKQVLDRWECPYESDAALAAKVRASAQPRRGSVVSERLSWWQALLLRPAYAAAFAAVCVLAGFGAARFLQPAQGGSAGSSSTYRLAIDPLYRLQAVAGIDDLGVGAQALQDGQSYRASTRARGLDWLQGELDLSSRQLERVAALHAAYEASIESLFNDLLASSFQYRELDRRRMSNDVVDYFQIYELLQRRKRLSEESVSLTAELLEKVGEVITPGQRSRFTDLLDNLYPSLAEVVAAS